MSTEWIANRFQVLEELGHGGMGTVYRVRDTLGEQRELALKTFRSDVPITPERRLRFREEFRAMSRLHHPNTIEVYDCGFLDGTTEYLTMELVPGRELADMLLDGPLPLETIYQLSLQLLLALEFIHSRLYVHRDIKPSNIRVRDDGVLKLMDFGLMEWLGSRTVSTAIGTAAYMAPECIVGGMLDASADLYSVGCVIYEMVTGRPPFLGTKSETLHAHLHETPRSLRAYRSEAPASLDELVSRLLAKDSRDRYASASEVADDIAQLANIHHIRADLARNQSYLVSDLMIGREQEFARIEELGQQAESGHGRAVFIAGPAGIGKTRLLQECLIQAKLRGAVVVHAQSKVGMNPYEALARALRPLLSLSMPEEFEAHLALADRLDNAVLELASRVSSGELPFDKQRLAADVAAWLGTVAARTPVVLAIEDLQWCDLSSVELLNHVIRHAQGRRLLIIATVRKDETSLGSPMWFTVQDGTTEVLKLGAFDRDRVCALVESMLRQLIVTEDFIDALYHATAGNPFFITEVMRDMMEQRLLVATEEGWTLPSDWHPDSLPASIDAVVLERLARLSEPVLALARVAAVLGSSLDRESLLELSGVEEEQLFAGVEALSERQFLAREDRRYVFPHDRVREALYQSTPIEHRRELHRRCGEWLERRHADALDGQLGALAFHFSRGEAHAKALDYTMRAAAAAKLGGAEVSAIDYWTKARELLEHMDHPEGEALRFDLDAKLAENALVLWPALALEAAERCRTALESRGNIDRISGALKKAVAVVGHLPRGARTAIMSDLTRARPYHHRNRRGLLPPVSSWAPKLLESYVLGCVAAGMAGEPKRGLPLGERALALLPFHGTPLEGAMCTALAACQISAGHLDAAAELLVRARTVLFEGDLGGQDFALSARVGAAVFTNQRVFQGLRFDPEILAFGEQATAEYNKPDFYNQLWAFPALWFAFTGRHEKATILLERIEDNCRRIGSPPYPWSLYLKPYLAWQRGAFDEARALIDLALRYAHIDRHMLAREYTCVLDGHVYLAVGELVEALEVFTEVERRTRKVGMDLVVVLALLGRAEVLTRFGELDLARMVLDEALTQTATGPTRNPLQHAIANRLVAELHIALGDYDEAAAAIRRATTIMSSPAQDNLIEQAHLLRTSAELELARKDEVDALTYLLKAEDSYAKLGFRYQARITHTRRLAAGLWTVEEPEPWDSGSFQRPPEFDRKTPPETLRRPDGDTAPVPDAKTFAEEPSMDADAETPNDGVAIVKLE